MTAQLDAVEAAVYRTRWVDAFGRDGRLATDRLIAEAAFVAADPSQHECDSCRRLHGRTESILARLRAAVALLGNDHITPEGRRILEKVLDAETAKAVTR